MGCGVARVPEAAKGTWYFEQLFVNGHRAMQARTPNKFYLLHGPDHGSAHRRQARPVPADHDRPRRDHRPAEGPERSRDSGRRPRRLSQMVHHARYLTAVNFEKNQIVTTGEKLTSFSDWPAGTRFHLENFKAALDEPGEWFLGRDGMLFYKPLPGEDMAKAEVVAPVATKLVILRRQARGRQVRRACHVQGPDVPAPAACASRRRATRPTRRPSPPMRRSCSMEREMSRSRTARSATSAEYAVWFRQGCQDCRIERSYLHDLGAGGVRIGEGQSRAEEASRTRSYHRGQQHHPHRRPDLYGRRGRLDRLQPRQCRHAQRDRRFLLHGALGRLALGLLRTASPNATTSASITSTISAGPS